MRSKIEHWPLLSFKEYENDINPKPTYQRSSVWKPEQRYTLIDSILRQIDIPKIYLRELENDKKYSYEIIDGKQRMSSIWDFLNDRFPLSETAGELVVGGKKYDVAELLYSELNKKIKMERIHKYSLDVVIIYEATEDEIADLFYRLNNGTPLTFAEVRNSMPGAMAYTIRNLANHSFFKKVSFKSGRYEYDQIVAQMMLLELNEAIQDTKDKYLSKMYGDYIKSVPEKAINNLEKTLNVLDKVFLEKSRFLNKTCTINLYLLISFLLKNTKIDKRFYTKFFEWYINTETIRSKNDEYKLYMRSSANTRKSIEGRFKIILYDFYKNFNDIGLVELDPQRLFNEKQKKEIYAKDKGICQVCFKKVNEKNWESDHKIPWIKGGKTNVDNGQVLCKKCNLSKRDKL